jgi:8-oxo-dGTP pyrophosphatase MutT (NUDIX family)
MFDFLKSKDKRLKDRFEEFVKLESEMRELNREKDDLAKSFQRDNHNFKLAKKQTENKYVLESIEERENNFHKSHIKLIGELKRREDKLSKAIDKTYPKGDEEFDEMVLKYKADKAKKAILKSYREGDINLSSCKTLLKAKTKEKVKYADNIVYDEQGRILLLKRSEIDTSKPGHFTIPGGHVDPGEDCETAAKRELKEEAGIDVDDVTQVGEYEDDKVHIKYYESRIENVEPVLQEEEIWSYEWVEPKNLKNYTLPFNMSENLDKIINPIKYQVVKIKKSFENGFINKAQRDVLLSKVIEKARQHKYIRKEPDGKGGWNYIYDEKEEKNKRDDKLRDELLSHYLSKDWYKKKGSAASLKYLPLGAIQLRISDHSASSKNQGINDVSVVTHESDPTADKFIDTDNLNVSKLSKEEAIESINNKLKQNLFKLITKNSIDNIQDLKDVLSTVEEFENNGIVTEKEKDRFLKLLSGKKMKFDKDNFEKVNDLKEEYDFELNNLELKEDKKRSKSVDIKDVNIGDELKHINPDISDTFKVENINQSTGQISYIDKKGYKKKISVTNLTKSQHNSIFGEYGDEVIEKLKSAMSQDSKYKDKLKKLKERRDPDNIRGGLADGKSVEDIAEHHDIPVSKIKKELKMGLKVEMEHTDNLKESSEIVRDHLWEIPDYYTRLAEMESEAKEGIEKGKKANIGEVRDWSGKKMKKVAPDKWEPVEESKSKEFIEVDGTLKPTINSNGKPIHPTEEGIKNFWKWFGDSKVVDENGKPLVVYHGSPLRGISRFGVNKKDKVESSGLREEGIFFTTNKELAKKYMREKQLIPEVKKEINGQIYKLQELQYTVRNNKDFEEIQDEIDRLEKQKRGEVYPVYLKIENPYVFDAKGKDGYEGWRELKVDAGYKIATGIDAMEVLNGKNTAARGEFNYDGVKAENIIDIHVQGDVDSPEVAKLKGDVWVTFNSFQIKSAVNNDGNFDSNESDITKTQEDIDIQKAWNKAQVGEVRTRKDGKKYRKVADSGNRDKDWKLITDAKGGKGEEDTPKQTGDKPSEGDKKMSGEELKDAAKNASETALNNAIKDSGDPKMREVAHEELKRREAEEKPSDEEAASASSKKETDKEDEKPTIKDKPKDA